MRDDWIEGLIVNLRSGLVERQVIVALDPQPDVLTEPAHNLFGRRICDGANVGDCLIRALENPRRLRAEKSGERWPKTDVGRKAQSLPERREARVRFE